jgi:hypothetical protein
MWRTLLGAGDRLLYNDPGREAFFFRMDDTFALSREGRCT